MLVRLLPLLAVCLIASGCSHRPYRFDFELRVPTSAADHLNADFNIVSQQSASGMPLKLAERRTEGEMTYYTGTGFINDHEGPYAVTIEWRKKSGQLFLLPFKSPSYTREWSRWMRPSYIEDTTGGSAGFRFMDGASAPRTTDLPAEVFELRYWVKSTKQR